MNNNPVGLNLYFASVPGDVRKMMTPEVLQSANPFKILASYHFFKKVDLDEMFAPLTIKPMVFADCGAYSAFTQGVEINIKDYADWLKRWAHWISVAVNLDVIRDADATANNQKILERLGCSVIPVFHTGSSLTILDDLCKRYPYIALGGMVGAERNVTLRWSATCMNRTKEYGTAFHGFGMTNRKNIETLPWYSVDSASWAGSFMYGRVPLWLGTKWETVLLFDKPAIYRHAPLIRRLGVDPAHLASRENYVYSDAVALAVNTWREYENYLRVRHGEIHLPQKSDLKRKVRQSQ